MLKSSLKGLDKKKLKRWILLFFFALAIPTAILIQQSYSRLKWETFHQHQLMADELASRINSQLLQLINSEEKRSFTDYSFLNIAGEPKANLLQRSPLSKFPVESRIAGIIGFFQVNNQGELMTPLVPEAIKSGKSADSFGISKGELDSRIALQDKIQDILSKNNLVKNKEPLDKKILVQKKDESTTFLDSIVGSSRSSQNQSQIAFDQLKNAPSKKYSAENKLGRVEDLKISKGYDVRFVKKEEIKKISVVKNKPRKQVRKEQNILPESELSETVVVTSIGKIAHEKRATRYERDASMASAGSIASLPKEKSTQPLRIRTFESSIDSFQFSQLDSGHFVLYRNVWLNKQRYIQGILIEQKPLLEDIVNTAFRNTALSQMSDLLVIYQGNVLTAFSGRSTKGYLTSNTELNGELLYQTRLSDPLSDLQLLFTIKQLPIGAGGKVILWLTFILTTILCAGFFLMYRLGMGQINLANQQQDFVSAVSHELKTPLTSIRMYGEMLREGWADEEKKKTYYNFIYDESERLSRLINNVLHLARMTRNEQSAVIKELSVAELMDEVQSKISIQIKQANFSLETECNDKTKASIIRVDEDWFIQIMINLVDNAIKFSSSSKIKKIDFSCQKTSKGKIIFSIRDYGPGVDKQQMKKIFKLFYRSESELTRETVGTGIGLALVHQMAVTMGGEIDVINQSPGAEFRVSFPSVTKR